MPDIYKQIMRYNELYFSDSVNKEVLCVELAKINKMIEDNPTLSGWIEYPMSLSPESCIVIKDLMTEGIEPPNSHWWLIT